mmetsp:Transcript_900/g.1668  ORF Transcript_900/g.1668 Transcript_900/m.1668 type:complete len:236 (-) Transcript_900:69-776(-)
MDYSNYNDIPPLLDAELGDLANFFILEEDDGGDGGCFIDDDDPLTSSIGSAAMDLQFEFPESCDSNSAVQEEEDVEDHMPTYNSGCHSRRDKQVPSPRPDFQMSVVDFDPPAQHQLHTIVTRHHQGQQPSCNNSHSDLSMCSSVQSSLAPSVNQQASESESATIHQHSKLQYNKALQKLAESMKRTEITRRHLMMLKRSEATRRHVTMHRSMLCPEQQRALQLAKERLNHQKQQW